MNFIHLLLLILVSACVSKEPNFSSLGKQTSGSPFFISQIGTQTIAPFGGSNANAESCIKLAVDHLGNTICIGNTNGNLADTALQTDIFILRTDSSGEM